MLTVDELVSQLSSDVELPSLDDIDLNPSQVDKTLTCGKQDVEHSVLGTSSLVESTVDTATKQVFDSAAEVTLADLSTVSVDSLREAEGERPVTNGSLKNLFADDNTTTSE